ncbi:hypothetical protein LIER_30617 [Lithospermum erythrorhizon]|uniref:Uncharacterized protein n=1 Tax=Lithospermum erythrorhizon TaxID=34254 RepID=A0AAV3RRH1_LITER
MRSLLLEKVCNEFDRAPDPLEICGDNAMAESSRSMEEVKQNENRVQRLEEEAGLHQKQLWLAVEDSQPNLAIPSGWRWRTSRSLPNFATF